MNEEFVNYEIAIKLNEKGFNLKTRYGYLPPIKLINESFIDRDWVELNGCPAPTIGQVLEWFRRKHGLHVEFACNASGYMFIVSDVPSKGGADRYYSNYSGPNDGGTWDEFKDCAFAAIGYVLNNLI